MCSHNPIFGTNRIGSLKTDRANGPKDFNSDLFITLIHSSLDSVGL